MPWPLSTHRARTDQPFSDARITPRRDAVLNRLSDAVRGQPAATQRHRSWVP
jgi:hypothetical protein